MHLISVSDFLSGLIVNDMAAVKNRVGVCSRPILLICALARPVDSNTLFCCGPDELQRLQLDQKVPFRTSRGDLEKVETITLKSIIWRL